MLKILVQPQASEFGVSGKCRNYGMCANLRKQELEHEGSISLWTVADKGFPKGGAWTKKGA